MRRLSVAAIVGGAIANIVAVNILNLPLLIYVLRAYGIGEMPSVKTQSIVERVIHAHFALYSIQVLIGLACSVLGGYVAATIAKRDRMLNAALASWLSVGLGLFALSRGHSGQSRYVLCAVIVITVFCYMMGAWLRPRGAAGLQAIG